MNVKYILEEDILFINGLEVREEEKIRINIFCGFV